MTHCAPIVSVVIPMFNVEKYIQQSVSSVLAQSYQHFEVICVDDGCTDNTLELLAEFNDSRIRVVSQKNKGLAAARNTGINNARGVYIALLDADDYWSPQKLSRHVQHLNQNPKVGVSYCPSLFVDDDSQELGIGQYPKLKGITARDIFCRNPVGNGSAAVLRRSMLYDLLERNPFSISANSEFFDERLRQSEDIEMWLRIALDTQWQFEGIAEPLTYYRVNSSGLSANLEKQYKSWLFAVSKNRKQHQQFFKRWFSLAKAYQLRYLARRAVQSRNSLHAIKLILSAMFCDIRILLEEPKKTAISFACAWLSLLPKVIYDSIEATAMKMLGSRKAQA